MRLGLWFPFLSSLAACMVENPAYDKQGPSGTAGAAALDEVAEASSDVTQDAATQAVTTEPEAGPLDGPSYPRASAFADPFGGTALSAAWETETTGTGCAMAIASGELRFRMNGEPGRCAVRTFALFDLRDDTAAVEVPPITHFFAPLWISMTVDGQDGAGVAFGFADGDMVVRVLDGVTIVSRESRPYPIAAHYWRVRSEQERLHFETSSDGLKWTTLVTRSASFPLYGVRLGISIEIVARMPEAVSIRVPGYNVLPLR